MQLQFAQYAAKNISTRVRVDSDTPKIDAIISSPIPKNIAYGAVAFVEKFAPDLIEVKVLHLVSTLENAEHLLKNNDKYSRWAAKAEILTLDHSGFRYLDGTLLHSSASQKKSYYLAG